MKRLLLLGLTVFLLLPLTATVCHANSAAPPAIIVVVSDAPDDLRLELGEQEAMRRDRPLASYFLFHQFETSAAPELIVSSSGERFSLPITTNKTYNNYFTLDLKERTLNPVESLPATRYVPLLMILLTLVIEGAVFFLFGYRKRRSWQVFLAVNLVTQLLLILWLGQYATFASFYDIFTLIIGESFVFIAELIAFMLLLKEHGRLRRVSYVIAANTLSLFLGGYLIWMFAI